VLAPGETVVMFGHGVPTVLCALERVTPMPFVDGWIMFAFGAHEPPFRDLYVARWREALADPSVRFYLVQHGVRRSTDAGGLSDVFAAEAVPPEVLQGLGYVPAEGLPVLGWMVWERAR
jgi:hypothetical protein